MLGKLFDRRPAQAPVTNASGLTGPRYPRHSGGWGIIRKRLLSEPGLRVLDVGATSPSNINYLTEMGHSVYMADLIADVELGDWKSGVDEDGKPVWNTDGFVHQNLEFSGRQFDLVLLWTELDFLPEALVSPVVRALRTAVVPGGQVLALFHTKVLPDHNLHYRFHTSPTDEVEVQLARPALQQRALTNRHIERLFADWANLKQLIAKDGVSEAIITR